MNKKVVLPATLGISLIGAILFATTSVRAQTPAPGTQTIIQRIAQRFNLNEGDVQAVFNASKQERHAQKLTQIEGQLSTDVTSGKITEAQKQLILNKMKETFFPSEMKELEQNHLEQLDGDHSQMKAQMRTKKAELENWARQNSIDLNYLLSLKGHGGMGGHGFHGENHTDTSSPTAQ